MSITHLLSFLSFLSLVLSLENPPQNPIIGIYTQNAEYPYNKTQYSTYLSASYIKNLQMAGAQVIPLFWHLSNKQLDSILPKLNGVFFPGGATFVDGSHPWIRTIDYIFQFAIKQNNEGKVYPIWGTCLGYQMLMYLTTKQVDKFKVITKVYGQWGKTCPQIIYNNDSMLLKSINQAEYKDLVSGNGIMFYHHNWAILKKTYDQSEALKNFWKLISTSKTEDGTQFVATVEAKNYPFFGTQYHPEKNSYQWRIPALRTSHSISVAQHWINTFISQAKKSKNRFPQQQLQQKIIYNYNSFLPEPDNQWTDLYIFQEDEQIKRLYGSFEFQNFRVKENIRKQ